MRKKRAVELRRTAAEMADITGKGSRMLYKILKTAFKKANGRNGVK